MTARTRPSPRPALGTDRGSASIYLLLVGVLLVAAAIVVTTLASVVTARHRAESVADLAALAAAGRVAASPSASCAAAAAITARQGATLLACVPAPDGSVRVEVGAPVRLGRLLVATPGQSGPLLARGRARAG
jgi:secretion/DNA translocation related TadE-like protein